MNIVKVIVDEMPETCADCKFLSQRVKGGQCHWECDAVDEWVLDIEATRPDWCPLITKKGYMDELFYYDESEE